MKRIEDKYTNMKQFKNIMNLNLILYEKMKYKELVEVE